MFGRVWSWLLDVAPVREAVRGQVRVAVEHVMDAVRAKFAALATSGVGVAILDAVAAPDLDTLATVCADLPFVGGGAGLAGSVGLEVAE